MFAGNAPVQESVRERLDQVLQQELTRLQTVTKERKISLPEHGSWEVALIIDSQFPPKPGLDEFGNLLNSSNPSLTGWPVWLSSRHF